MHRHALNFELTFAGIHALRPLVIDIPVAGTPAVLKPGATRSATAYSAGFLEHAALWARRRTDCWGD